MSRPKRLRAALLTILPLVGALALRSLVVEGTGAGAPRESARARRLSPPLPFRGWTPCSARPPARPKHAREVALGARRADEDREVHEIPVAGRAPIDDAPGDATAERVEVVYLPRARLLALVAAGLSAPEALARVDALRLVEANAIPEVASQIERLALEDPDESVRRIATRVLARGDGSDGRELLRRLARDVDAGVRAFALLGLSRRGEPGAEELLASCVEGARQAAPDLVPAIERLVASVRDD